MNKNLINKLGILILSAAGSMFATSCESDSEPVFEGRSTTSVFATLPGTFIGSTRGGTDPQDGWSTMSFNSVKDTIGLYSNHGNNKVNNGEGGFVNAPLIYTRSVGEAFQFDNLDLDMDRSKFEYDKTSLYYPYAIGMEEKGLNLRKTAGDGSRRCVDFLEMGSLNQQKLQKEQQLSGNFSHIFSEIIITRGEGFDNPTDPTIKVVLNKGYSHVKLIDNTTNFNKTTWKVPQLVYNPECGMTENDCREWEAWHGQPIHPDGSEVKDAWYVIVPNMMGSQANTSNYTLIDYIEIYDNAGELHKITSFTFYNGTKQVQPEWRYPIEIKMEGLVPQVYPYKILPWGEDTDITDERTTGIKTSSEFYQFVTDYNAYKASGNEGNLSSFGDKIIAADGSVTWQFYILNNIDLSGIKDLRISTLTDEIDGLGNTISNLQLDNSLIGEITGTGSLKDLNIEGLSVINTEKNVRLGALTNRLSADGSIINCKVDASVYGESFVGIMAGTMTGGMVENCTFTGLLIGNGTATGTYRYLIAETPDLELDIKDTNYAGIIYTKKD